VRAFAGNEDVSFGDIDLSRERIVNEHWAPGVGGWPTIMYFNQETGVEGGHYYQYTDDPVCKELGNHDIMIAYVEEDGNTCMCKVNGSGCGEDELSFIEKVKSKNQEELTSELEKIEKELRDTPFHYNSERKFLLLKQQKILIQFIDPFPPSEPLSSLTLKEKVMLKMKSFMLKLKKNFGLNLKDSKDYLNATVN